MVERRYQNRGAFKELVTILAIFQHTLRNSLAAGSLFIPLTLVKKSLTDSAAF